MQELVKQAINTDVEAYWESGGKLNRGSFEAAMSVLLEQANKEERGVDDSSLVQAENMVRFSQIPITPEQRYLYAVHFPEQFYRNCYKAHPHPFLRCFYIT